MRLRYGRPSLFILILFAIIAGIAFYLYDNQPDPITPTPTSAAVASVPTFEPITTITPTLFAPPPTPGPAPTSMASRGLLNEIPANTTIFIPRAGIYSSIIQAYLNGESWDVSQLGTHVGHLEGTAWINQPGNVVLSGHVEMADGRPGVFANLSDLAVDDIIIVNTNSIEYRYIVREIRYTTPDDLNPIMPTTIERLTLITCDSYDFLTDTYRERMIVVAERWG